MREAEAAGAVVTDPARERFGADIPVTSMTRMAICGRSPGTRTGAFPIDRPIAWAMFGLVDDREQRLAASTGRCRELARVSARLGRGLPELL